MQPLPRRSRDVQLAPIDWRWCRAKPYFEDRAPALRMRTSTRDGDNCSGIFEWWQGVIHPHGQRAAIQNQRDGYASEGGLPLLQGGIGYQRPCREERAEGDGWSDERKDAADGECLHASHHRGKRAHEQRGPDRDSDIGSACLLKGHQGRPRTCKPERGHRKQEACKHHRYHIARSVDRPHACDVDHPDGELASSLCAAQCSQAIIRQHAQFVVFKHPC